MGERAIIKFDPSDELRFRWETSALIQHHQNFLNVQIQFGLELNEKGSWDFVIFSENRTHI